MRVVMTMNKRSLGIVREDAVNVRVRVLNGVLQIKPTFRTATTNFPMDEVLAPLADIKGVVPGKRADLALTDMTRDVISSFAGKMFEIEEKKYGWLALNPTDSLDNKAGVRVGSVVS